ncbi:MAG TPA: c-type cytochrome [Bryobacteraceae bacterium]|nr:c-type cytochrome [Bryobacteraceae bacterium]
MTKLIAMLILAAASRGDLIQRTPASAAGKTNPYADDRDAVLAGRKLFSHHCAACHGREAQGNGKAPPLAQPVVQNAAPGLLFHLITNGSLRRGMPSFAALPEPQRWQIVTYLKGLKQADVR